MLASELYAKSQLCKNSGPEMCHWCGSPCSRNYRHNEPPPSPFTKKNHLVRCPANLHICVGCFLWRRQRITINHTDGSYRDGQCPMNHSWWIAENEALAVCNSIVNPHNKEVYDRLLRPPLQFSLSLVNPKTINHLQCQVVNDMVEIKADTKLSFTLDNQPLSYTVYELEQALRHGLDGKEPGVQALIRFLGPHTLTTVDVQKVAEVKPVGRPAALVDAKVTKKVIVKSGG